MPENLVWIHPAAAARFAIESGDYVRLVNQDGRVSNPVRVRVTERIAARFGLAGAWIWP